MSYASGVVNGGYTTKGTMMQVTEKKIEHNRSLYAIAISSLGKDASDDAIFAKLFGPMGGTAAQPSAIVLDAGWAPDRVVGALSRSGLDDRTLAITLEMTSRVDAASALRSSGWSEDRITAALK